jgi:prophage regulatory protein
LLFIVGSLGLFLFLRPASHRKEVIAMAQTFSPRRILRLPDVKHQVGLGRTAIYQKIKAGEFPAPIPLSNNGRAVGWDSEAINAWIESRIQAAGVAK